jgi:TnsA endonuclease N terminal
MGKAMTWDKLLRMIEEGHGQGHGEAYRPFIQIRRKNCSPKGNQSVGPLPGCARPFHALTRVERQIGMLCYWLGASDVREQLPAWPFPHPHPLVGASGAESPGNSIAPGLFELAEKANIDHGVFPGSDVPYVATLDVVATVPTVSIPRIVVISCKAGTDIEKALLTSRMIERLELERRYCEAISVRYHVAHELALSEILLSNLEICSVSVLQQHRICAAAGFQAFKDRLKETIRRTSIRQAVDLATSTSGLDASFAWPAFHLLAWQMEIDIDLSQPKIASQLAVSGGRALHETLYRRLFVGGAE